MSMEKFKKVVARNVETDEYRKQQIQRQQDEENANRIRQIAARQDALNRRREEFNHKVELAIKELNRYLSLIEKAEQLIPDRANFHRMYLGDLYSQRLANPDYIAEMAAIACEKLSEEIKNTQDREENNRMLQTIAWSQFKNILNNDLEHRIEAIKTALDFQKKYFKQQGIFNEFSRFQMEFLNNVKIDFVFNAGNKAYWDCISKLSEKLAKNPYLSEALLIFKYATELDNESIERAKALINKLLPDT